MKYSPLSGTIKLLLSGPLLLTLFSLFNRWSVLAEVIVSLRPFLFFVSAVICIIALLCKYRKVFWLLLMAIVVNGLPLVAYFPTSSVQQGDLQLLVYNADKNRLPYVGVQEVVTLVETNNPTIAVLLEIGTEQSSDLQDALIDQYPFTLSHQDAAHDGFLVFSHYPLENGRAQLLGAGRKTGLVDVLIDGTHYHLIAPHPTNALFDFDERNSQLSSVAAYVSALDVPTIVAGDLNVTMWSSWYQDIEDAGLRNVRQGFGIMPTWRLPIPLPLLRIPLDHILVSSEIEVLSAEILPSPGSDHAPLLATFSLTK